MTRWSPADQAHSSLLEHRHEQKRLARWDARTAVHRPMLRPRKAKRTLLRTINSNFSRRCEDKTQRENIAVEPVDRCCSTQIAALSCARALRSVSPICSCSRQTDATTNAVPRPSASTSVLMAVASQNVHNGVVWIVEDLRGWLLSKGKLRKYECCGSCFITYRHAMSLFSSRK
jgi:hypothetical protein